MKLLIIEDEISLQELMTKALRKEGYVVENAMDYNSAPPAPFGCTLSPGEGITSAALSKLNDNFHHKHAPRILPERCPCIETKPE